MSTLLGFFHAGGGMMYVLTFTSIILITLSIERLITLRRASRDGDGLLDEIKRVTNNNPKSNIQLAQDLCLNTGGSLGRMFERGLRNSMRDADAIEMAMEQEAANETPMLEANLTIIKTIVNIAPLLGLLGTIAGMMGAFHAAQLQGLNNPTAILGGVGEALISTATGITLAIIGFIAFNYFSLQSRKIVEDMEYYGAELVNYLTGRVD